VAKSLFLSIASALFLLLYCSSSYISFPISLNLDQTVEESYGDKQAGNAEDLYQTYLNVTQLPPSIRELKGNGSNTFPVFLSSGYFTYIAEPEYFDYLKSHNRFIEASEFNTQIHEVSCIGPEFSEDFSWWTDETIKVEEKICFTGTFFPYLHYLLYDEESHQVEHFVTGMRD
jgi:hypothetical protein